LSEAGGAVGFTYPATFLVKPDRVACSVRDDEEQVMAIEPEELEEIPPQGHVKVVYTGPIAPHWEIHRVFGDQHMVDEFRQRAMARLQLLPVYDPQFRRNRERVARDAEREHLILEWDLGDEPE
jgi:hypothetical protein